MTSQNHPSTLGAGRQAQLFCFVHIQKCGGTTLNTLLRRNFGLRHVDLIPVSRLAVLASGNDIKHAMRVYPRAFSFAGHSLRPFGDFGAFRERMVFYTLLRDPVQRFISDYHEHRRHFDMSLPFETWAAETTNSDWQVNALSRSGNLEEAKEVLATQFALFDLVENYPRFVTSLSSLMAPHRLSAWYEKKNVGTEKSAEDAALERAVAQRPQTLEIALAANRKDTELMRWAQNFLSERYAKTLPLPPAQAPTATAKLAQRTRQILNLTVRNAIYKPSVGLWPTEVDILPTYRMYIEKQSSG